METIVAERGEIYIRDLTDSSFDALDHRWRGAGDTADITSAEVDQWIQSLNVGPQTQNNFRAVLSAMWTFAVRRGYATVNAIQFVDKSSVVRDHIPTFPLHSSADSSRSRRQNISRCW